MSFFSILKLTAAVDWQPPRLSLCPKKTVYPWQRKNKQEVAKPCLTSNGMMDTHRDVWDLSVTHICPSASCNPAPPTSTSGGYKPSSSWCAVIRFGYRFRSRITARSRALHICKSIIKSRLAGIFWFFLTFLWRCKCEQSNIRASSSMQWDKESSPLNMFSRSMEAVEAAPSAFSIWNI